MSQTAVSPARSLLGSVRRHKILYVVTAVLCFAVAGLGVLVLPPAFEATALTVVGQRDIAQDEGGARKDQEEIATLASIAESDEVVRMAIERTGLNAFGATAGGGEAPLFLRLRAKLYPEQLASLGTPTQLDRVLRSVVRRVRVRTQPLSNVIRISYQDADPVFAARFANALAQAFVDRQLQLFQQSGAVEFFAQQMKIFDGELQREFAEFQKFAKASGVYTIDDQRALLLRRLDELSAATNQTRASIADKKGQRQAISAQLRRLAPVARSPYVSSLVTSFGDTADTRDAEAKGTDDRTADAPLLLVRAYQDSISALFRVNADLSGLERIEAEQTANLETLRRRLTALIDAEPAFESRRRAIQAAQRNKEAYERRMIDERVSQESRAAKLSSVKIFQSALTPRDPVFPQYPIALGLALVLSAGAALGVVRLRDAVGRRPLDS